jgi:hypothetical protein
MTNFNKKDIFLDVEYEEEEEELEELSPEEKAEEEAGLKEAKDEELKASVAEKFGIDGDLEPELLAKLVENEKSHREKLSKTIKQKISWREKVKPSKKIDSKKPIVKNDKTEVPDIDKLLEEKLEARLAERDLKDLNLPESIENEVKELSKIRGISIGEAAKLPYIVARREEIEREKRIEDGTLKRNNKGTYKNSFDPSKPLNYADFDLSSEEGRKEWNNAKAKKAEYEKTHK